MTRTEDYNADVALAEDLAAILKIDPRRVLYQLHHGEPKMRSLARENRRRRRELAAAEAERIAAQDHERGDEPMDNLELRRKGFTMRSERLRAVVKSAGGVTALCKRIVKDGSAGDITEHELTELLVSAKAAQPDLSDAQAFSRMFTDMSPAGEAMRKAITIAKSGPLPDDKERDDEDEEERDEGRDDDAMDELHAKANELRKRLPHLSPEQAFTKVYADPANRRLTARERRQNSPLRRVV